MGDPAGRQRGLCHQHGRRAGGLSEAARSAAHGSWLDIAESELGVLASQCLDRRIADKKILAHEVNAWQHHRNKHHAKANWQFKTADARVKLKRLYPQFE
jgi:hypothetical protein